MGDISYVATLDLGTTTIRCHVINSLAETVSTATTDTKLLYPQPGYVEIDPDDLWKSVISVIKQAIDNAQLQPKDIKCLGITTQRATFITWRKDTGEYLHNFITWKDLRSKELVKKWNNSYLLKGIQSGAYFLYFFGRNHRHLMGSRIKLTTTQCTCRLLWVLNNIPEVKQEAAKQNLCFGTIDTWLIHKLTGRMQFISEVSHASSTGLYDPFEMAWSDWPSFLLGIPNHIYPKVVNSDYDFGDTIPDIFGTSIPIKSVIADQQASLFGTCCFEQDDTKITIGTGSFIDINTKSQAIATVDGSYPLVAWTLGNISTYVTEAACKDAGSLIQWAVQVGIAKDISEISNQGLEVEDSDGVFFIPSFSGLGPPILDDHAATGFIGIKPTTTKNHLMRAILESIVFTIVSACKMLEEKDFKKFDEICVDGGVSNNNFVCQLLADLIDAKIFRYTSHEKTILGATLLAGLNTGIWKSTNDLLKLRKVQDIFEPDSNITRKKKLSQHMEEWLKATKRFGKWYS